MPWKENNLESERPHFKLDPEPSLTVSFASVRLCTSENTSQGFCEKGFTELPSENTCSLSWLHTFAHITATATAPWACFFSSCHKLSHSILWLFEKHLSEWSCPDSRPAGLSHQLLSLLTVFCPPNMSGNRGAKALAGSFYYSVRLVSQWKCMQGPKGIATCASFYKLKPLNPLCRERGWGLTYTHIPGNQLFDIED